MSYRAGARGSRAPFLLDTHIWFWHAIGSKRLHRRLRNTLDDAADELWLSPVSIWELGLLYQRGRVQMDRGPRAWVAEALAQIPLHDASLTREVALVSDELALHGDPADRFLAATALVHRLTLVTVDERLTSASWLPTLSD